MTTDNRAPAPSRARRYLAALTLARSYDPDEPTHLRSDIEVLLALEAAYCGNSVPGEIERRVESYLDERGVVVTEHGAEWVPALRAVRRPCAECKHLAVPPDKFTAEPACNLSKEAQVRMYSAPINCPLALDED